MQLEHTYVQPLSFPAGFFRELWYLARAIILAFFIAVLISSVFSAQVRGGSECSQAECRSFEQNASLLCVCVRVLCCISRGLRSQCSYRCCAVCGLTQTRPYVKWLHRGVLIIVNNVFPLAFPSLRTPSPSHFLTFLLPHHPPPLPQAQNMVKDFQPDPGDKKCKFDDVQGVSGRRREAGMFKLLLCTDSRVA